MEQNECNSSSLSVGKRGSVDGDQGVPWLRTSDAEIRCTNLRNTIVPANRATAGVTFRVYLLYGECDGTLVTLDNFTGSPVRLRSYAQVCDNVATFKDLCFMSDVEADSRCDLLIRVHTRPERRAMCWGVTIVSTRSGAQSGINRSLVNEKQLSFGANLDSGLGSYGALTSAAPVNGIQSESMLRYETKQERRFKFGTFDPMERPVIHRRSSSDPETKLKPEKKKEEDQGQPLQEPKRRVTCELQQLELEKWQLKMAQQRRLQREQQQQQQQQVELELQQRRRQSDPQPEIPRSRNSLSQTQDENEQQLLSLAAGLGCHVYMADEVFDKVDATQ